MTSTLPASRPALGAGMAGAVAAGYATAWILGRAAGANPAERRAKLPGDGIVPSPDLVTDHAITLRATPGRIWPWLTQMGWHRGGYYTPRWVDRVIFPANWPSLEVLDPALVRDLAVGDTIPDGPPGTAEYVVVEVDAPRVLVLHSTTHVPPGWQERHGAAISWTWVFCLTPGVPGSTRLHVRVRGRMEPRWFRMLYQAALVPADLVMATGMLRGLKRRVETDVRRDTSVSFPG